MSFFIVLKTKMQKSPKKVYNLAIKSVTKTDVKLYHVRRQNNKMMMKRVHCYIIIRYTLLPPPV